MSAYLRPLLADLDGVVAAYSTRHGGVSTAPFHSLNLGLNTGDEAKAVLSNQSRFLGQLGIRLDQLARAEQVHGSAVATVEAPGAYRGVDALVTARPGIALAIAAADCAVVLLVDPTARVAGAAHAGWRGAAANIVRATVRAMQAIGAVPANIHAFVGPCISAANFEVGPEVAAQFAPEHVREPVPGQRPHVDLRAVLDDQLVEVGVPEKAIETCPFCTFDRTDDFFSYRKEGGRTGRMMGVIMLQPERVRP